MIKMIVKSSTCSLFGSRVWFDKIDEYGVDSILKANGLGTSFYGKHPLEYGARRKVYVFYPRVEHTISTLI